MSIQEVISGKDRIGLLTEILNRIHKEGPTSAKDFESLAYLKKFHAQEFSQFESKLVFLIGLFYKTGQPKSFIEEVYSIFGKTIEEETGRRFTPVQASAYKKIYKRRYFSFSAPTSSGKSYLFKELIKNAEGDIIIVIPSRALIAEYIHAITKIVPKEVLVLQFIENINILNTKRRIYVITPERGDDLFKIVNQLNIELFLFDEAQISEEEIRGMKFDAFVRRVDKLIPQAKKVFTHPFVKNPEAQLQKHNFSNNSEAIRYDQNSVGKIYLTRKDHKYFYFSPFDGELGKTKIDVEYDIVLDIIAKGGTLLIYTSKSKIYDGSYIKEFSGYIEKAPKITDPNAKAIIKELRKFIGATSKSEGRHSAMIEMMEKGIVIHHGSMPLKARLIIESFVNKGFAHICFATSTLTQGINMPFDVVWISNFKFQGGESQKNLDLKNLIGRAGRSTGKRNSFDYGYVIIEHSNVKTFCGRINQESQLSPTSSLEKNLDLIPEDLKDIAEAIKTDSFNSELNLTNNQIERINQANIQDDIKLILDLFLVDGRPIMAREYYKIPKKSRRELKTAFMRVFVSHLRRQDLTKGESAILSTAIPILLWRIQGKSFREIVSLRHAYLSEKDKRRSILQRLKKGEISMQTAEEEMKALKVKFTAPAAPLPNISAKHVSLFTSKVSVEELDYDILVYDTYDYIDKVISLSLSDPLSAAFHLYYKETQDMRARILENYIKYGTNDITEIWLLRYGFGFEDIDWIKKHVQAINENQITFRNSANQLKSKQREVISRFI